jgi:hypothetical protein
LPAAISAARPEPPRTGTTARWFGTRLIYIERSTVEIGAIQLRNSSLGFPRFCHFDEREAARLAGVPVRDDIYALHAAVSSESRMKIILGGLITEISDKYVCHSMDSFLVDLSLSDCSRTNLSEGNVAAGRHSKRDTDAGKDTLTISVFHSRRFLEARWFEATCPHQPATVGTISSFSGSPGLDGWTQLLLG